MNKKILSLTLALLIIAIAVIAFKINYNQKPNSNTNIVPDTTTNNTIVKNTEPDFNSTVKEPSISPTDAKNLIGDNGAKVINILKSKDMNGLSEYIHPTKGIRFSAYQHVNKADLVFDSAKIKDFLKDNTKYTWGIYDGSGEPINLTPLEYYNKFIYSADFANASTVTYNQIAKPSNMIENQFGVYKDAIIVEYHIPQIDKQYEGMDWQSLRLVFEKYNDKWYLVGAIHGQWTI